jgi:hypothetical protein
LSHSGLDRTLYSSSLHSDRMAIKEMWNIQPIVGMYTYPSRNGNQGFVGYLKGLWGCPHHHRISIKFQISPPLKCRDAMYSVRHNAAWLKKAGNNLNSISTMEPPQFLRRLFCIYYSMVQNFSGEPYDSSSRGIKIFFRTTG